MRTRLTRVLATVGAALVAVASAPPRVSAQAAQPPAEGTAAAAAPAAPADDGMRALLARPEAVSVATARCRSTEDGCALSEARHEALKTHFNGTLRTGDGADTPFAAAVKDLLTAAGTGAWPQEARNAIVHVVWRAQEGQPLRDRWLTATRHGQGANARIELSFGRRLLGVKKLAVLFAHLDVPSADGAAGFDAEYRAIVDRKRAVNVEHLLALFKAATMRAAQAAAKPHGVFGAGLLDDIATPSDITAFCVRVTGAAEPGILGQSIVYDNEGKYIWDVSVAAPINKITLVEYVDVDGAFLPKALNKQSIYGTLNLYPVPVDLKSGNARWLVPRAIVGLGMTGRPGENFLLGVAFGIPQVQFFAGSAFANQRTLIPGRDPADGTSYRQRYGSRFAYGINVPVLFALKKLTPKG